MSQFFTATPRQQDKITDDFATSALADEVCTHVRITNGLQVQDLTVEQLMEYRVQLAQTIARLQQRLDDADVVMEAVFVAKGAK